MIKASLRALTAIEKVTSIIAACFMFAIMIIVFSDVVMRYVFNRPFSWAYDLISLYIMAGVFFLSLSGTYAVNGHISVDILLPRFSAAIQRLCIIISNLVGLAIFIPITWLGYQRARERCSTPRSTSALLCCSSFAAKIKVTVRRRASAASSRTALAPGSTRSSAR